MKKINNFQLLLLISSVISVSVLIRYLLLVDFSPEFAIFGSYAGFSDIYTITNGHLPNGNSVIAYDQFSGQVAASTQLHPILILRPLLFLILGMTPISWEFQLVMSLAYLLPFVGIILLFLKNRDLNKWDVLILVFYALLATPNVISAMTYGGATVTNIVIFAFILFYLQQENSSKKFIMLLMGSILAISYYTGALAFIVIIWVLLLFEYHYRSSNKSLYMNILFTVVFLTYVMYVCTGRFSSLVHFFDNLINLFRGEGFSTSGGLGLQKLLTPYIISTSIESKIRILINSVLVSLPVIYFIFWGRKYITEKKERMVSFSIIISLGLITLFTYMVIGGVGRLVEYGTLTSIVIAVLMVGKIKIDHWRAIRIVLILAIISSTFAYINSENNAILRVTYPEDQGSQFLLDKISGSDLIYTDFRLGSLFTEKGHFNTTGVTLTSDKQFNSSINIMDNLYWKNKDINATLSNIKLRGNSIDYCFISNEMFKDVPGIRVYSYNLKPISMNFTSEVAKVKSINRVYDNGDVFIFKVQ